MTTTALGAEIVRFMEEGIARFGSVEAFQAALVTATKEARR